MSLGKHNSGGLGPNVAGEVTQWPRVKNSRPAASGKVINHFLPLSAVFFCPKSLALQCPNINLRLHLHDFHITHVAPIVQLA